MGSGVIMCVIGWMYCMPLSVQIASSDVHMSRLLSTAFTSVSGHWNVYIASPLLMK